MKPSVLYCSFLAALTFALFFPLRAGEAAKKVVSLSSADPIQAMLADISADSIRSYIQTLEGFTTRHTNSDTISDTKGIGAARRWVFKKFQQFSQQSGGKLIPEYFDFSSSNIQGVTRLNRNIQARLPGTMAASKDRIFIVSGHVDGRTVDGTDFTNSSPAANDDGSGTAIALELARVMSKYQFDATLIFMTVVGEDEGLYGSDAYAKWAKANSVRIDGMITNDVIGNIVGSNGITDSMSVRHFSSLSESTPHRQMSRYLKLVAEPYLPGFTINLIPDVDRPGRGGDHQSFQAAGFTAVRFTEPNENLANQHSPTDLLANMSPSYTARVARVNIVGLSRLAWAPATPTLSQVLSPGNGSSLVVKWSTTNSEPDLGGYRVAVREQGSLTYSKILDAGKVNQYTVTGLTSGVPVYISISAYDTSGYESVFSNEIINTPAVVPDKLQNVGATSTSTSITVRWDASPELDIVKYRLYRSTSLNPDYQLVDSVNVPTTSWVQPSPQAHVMYNYQIAAVDQDNNQSVASTSVRGRLATHDSGILIVDDTRHGVGTIALSPSNKQVDDYYAGLTSQFTIAGQWDVAESVKVSVDNRIKDADMGIYSTLIWHSDVRSSSPIILDSTEIKKFLATHGRLIMSGWKLSASLFGSDIDSTVFPSQSYVPTFFKIPAIRSTDAATNDFVSAASLIAGYPAIKMDSAKLPIYGGALPNMDAFSTPLVGEPTTQTIYTYVSVAGAASPLNGRPVALRYLGSDYKVIIFDFPLYYMMQPEAKTIMQRALLDIGEITSVEDRSTSPAIPAQIELSQNYPNPFNPTTSFRFTLADERFVSLKIYDVLGKEVTSLVSEDKKPGSYSVQWNASEAASGISSKGGYASGVYFYTLRAGNFIDTKKMVLLK